MGELDQMSAKAKQRTRTRTIGVVFVIVLVLAVLCPLVPWVYHRLTVDLHRASTQLHSGMTFEKAQKLIGIPPKSTETRGEVVSYYYESKVLFGMGYQFLTVETDRNGQVLRVVYDHM